MMEFDFHCHSKYSFDSTMEPKRIVRLAKSRGLRGMAITDHNSGEGAAEALQYQDDGFFIIRGMEVTTNAGDIVGLFLSELKGPSTKDPLEVVKWIHDQGGLAILAHPFIQHATIPKGLPEALDGCEAFNARYAHLRRGEGAFTHEQIEAFAREYDLTMVGVSDAHFYGDIAKGRTVIPAQTPEEVRDALEAGTTAVSGGEPSPMSGLLSEFLGVAKRLLGGGKGAPPTPPAPGV